MTHVTKSNFGWVNVVSNHIKPCPMCGDVGMYRPIGSGSYAISCQNEKCRCKGLVVTLPDYYAKGGNRLMSRMFMRALNGWNTRVNSDEVEEVVRKFNLKNRRLP